MDKSINNTAGEAAVINQIGSREDVNKNGEVEVFIPAPKKEEEPKSEKEKGLTTSPREQVNHKDKIVWKISHFFQILEI